MKQYSSAWQVHKKEHKLSLQDSCRYCQDALEMTPKVSYLKEFTAGYLNRHARRWLKKFQVKL